MVLSRGISKDKLQRWNFPIEADEFRATLTDGIYIHRKGHLFLKIGPELRWHKAQLRFDCSKLGQAKAEEYAFFVAKVHNDLAEAGYFHPNSVAITHTYRENNRLFCAVSVTMPRLENLPNIDYFYGAKKEEWMKRVSGPVSILKNYLKKKGLLSKIEDIDLAREYPEKNPSDNFGIDPETGDVHAIDIGLWTVLPSITKFRKAFQMR